MVAAPCGRTGREGGRGGGRGDPGAHRPYGARVSTSAGAVQKAPNPNFGSCLARSLPARTRTGPRGAGSRNLAVCNRTAYNRRRCNAILNSKKVSLQSRSIAKILDHSMNIINI